MPEQGAEMLQDDEPAGNLHDEHTADDASAGGQVGVSRARDGAD